MSQMTFNQHMPVYNLNENIQNNFPTANNHSFLNNQSQMQVPSMQDINKKINYIKNLRNKDTNVNMMGDLDQLKRNQNLNMVLNIQLIKKNLNKSFL